MTKEKEIKQQTRGWVPKDATLSTSSTNRMVNSDQKSDGGTTSRVECPHCHYKFNYEWIPGISIFAIKLGPYRLFKCPNCKELHTFKITDFGSDPSLPTHGDNYSETGIGIKKLVLLIGPLIVLSTVAAILPALGYTDSFLILSPAIVGIAWIAIYIIYLNLKSRQNRTRATQEAK